MADHERSSTKYQSSAYPGTDQSRRTGKSGHFDPIAVVLFILFSISFTFFLWFHAYATHTHTPSFLLRNVNLLWGTLRQHRQKIVLTVVNLRTALIVNTTPTTFMAHFGLLERNVQHIKGRIESQIEDDTVKMITHLTGAIIVMLSQR